MDLNRRVSVRHLAKVRKLSIREIQDALALGELSNEDHFADDELTNAQWIPLEQLSDYLRGEPGFDIGDESVEPQRRLRVLPFYSKLSTGLGWFVLVGTPILTFIGIMNADGQNWSLLLTGLIGVFIGMSMIAQGETGSCLMSIEKNMRKINEVLRLMQSRGR